MNKLRDDTANQTYPTIQLATAQFNQVTATGHSDQKHFPIGILNSGIDVPKYGRNIDNHTDINPQEPIVTTIPESSKTNNCDIFDLVNRKLDLT